MSARRARALSNEVSRLRAENAEKDRRIAELTAKLDAALRRIAELEETVRDLKARLGQNSSNSSRPPSSDPPWAPPPTRKRPTGRRPGGQPGHKGHRRVLVPEERVDRIVPLKPAKCRRCRAPLFGDDPSPNRHQVVEIPQPKAVVTEYRCHTLACGRCGESTTADLPPDVPKGAFGPRLQAAIALLTGVYHLSVRATKALIEDQFGVPISEGSIVTCQKATSEALAAPVEEAHRFVAEAKAANADETSWRERGRRAWLWILTTPLVAVFLIHARRNAEAARALLRTFRGILGSDRWSAYTFVPTRRREICWAHIERDFEGFVERGGDGERIGKALLVEVGQLFKLWYRVRDGTLRRSSFRTAVGPIRHRVRTLLEEGSTCRDRKVAGKCREILVLEPALWTFVRVEGVEPTNNAAERGLRSAVLWRKNSFGTHSPEGSRFVERMLTVATTLRLQKRNVTDYLTEVCQAALQGTPPPSLLPGLATERQASVKRAA